MKKFINSQITSNLLSDYHAKQKNIQEVLIKKLLHQSKNRGCREMDLLLGNFAEILVPKMDLNDLENVALILFQDDNDIYRWITKKSKPPQELDSNIMQQLLNYFEARGHSSEIFM